MPSYKEKYAVDAPAPGTVGLNQRERNHIRSKLGIANDPAQPLFGQTEQRMQGFAQEQVDEARALYKALDKIGDASTSIQGGSRALFVSDAEDRSLLRRELMNLIMPTNDVLLGETIHTVTEQEIDGNEFFAINVNYSNRRKSSSDEYGCDD